MHPHLSLRSSWPAVVSLLAAGLLAYANSFSGPFVFDDLASIVDNPSIRQLWPLSEVLSPPRGGSLTVEGRPVLNLTFALNHAWGGLDVRGYHGVNLLIHLLAGLTLWAVVRRTLLQPRVAAPWRTAAGPIAWSVALLWTVHPLQTESVTYIVQRAESLMGLFYLLTFYGFIRGVDTGGRAGRVWLGASVTACLLGMGTKEVMASAPLLVLLYDRTFVSGTWREAWYRRRGYYLALAGTWLGLAALVAGTGGNRSGIMGWGVGVPGWQYWLTQAEAIWCYLRLAFWPHPLVFEYGVFWVEHPWRVLPGLLGILALAAATLVALKRWPMAGFLGGWFFALLAPTSLVPSTTQMIVEHRMYLALAAVVAGLVAGLHLGLTRRRRLAEGAGGRLGLSLLVGALAVVFIALTSHRNEDYRTALALWRDTVEKRPHNALAHHLLAAALAQDDQPQPAIAHYRESLRLEPRFALAHGALGELLAEQGQAAEGQVHLRRALELRPDYLEAREALAVVLLQAGEWTEAVRHLEIALQIQPEQPQVHYYLANALAAGGEAAAAIEHFEAALRGYPPWPEAHYNLANTLFAQSRSDDARRHYEAALSLRPDYVAAHYNLGNLLALGGDLAAAVPHYRAVLRLQPEHAEAHNNLGNVFLGLEEREAAARHYAAALRLRPDLQGARENLARLQAAAPPGAP